MKIRLSQLKRIIKEEVESSLQENDTSYEGAGIVSQLGRLTQDVYRISNQSDIKDRQKEADSIANELKKMQQELKAILVKKN